MTENFDIYYKVVSTVVAIIFGYHKYLMRQLDKKMDKDDCNKQQEILTQKRNNLETLFIERTKTLFNHQKEIKEDLRIIKEYVAKGGNYDR